MLYPYETEHVPFLPIPNQCYTLHFLGPQRPGSYLCNQWNVQTAPVLALLCFLVPYAMQSLPVTQAP